MPFGLRRPAQPQPIPGGLRDVPQLIAHAAAERPAETAMLDAGRPHSYADLATAMEAGAAALYASGVRPGDRVAVSAANRSGIIHAFLATQRLGAIWVGISQQLAAPELEYQLRDCGARLFVGDDAWLDLLEAHRGQSAPAIEIDPLAPAAIAYTSGTTGRPKGSTHSQHGLMVVAVHSVLRSRAKGQAMRRAATLPLTILNVMAKEALAAFAAGGTFIPLERKDALGVAEAIARERVESIVCAPPTVMDFIERDDIAPAAMASIEALTCGGAHCPQSLREGFQRKFGKPLYVSWGQTEVPASVSGGFTDEGPPDASGRVFDHLEVVARGPDGQPVAPGEPGELYVRAARSGPWAGVFAPMLGYWGMAEETDAVLPGGELRTGDIGRVDQDGFVTIVDRAKSVIIRGGQNVYPAEIERLLKSHPDVRDAAVLSAPDPRFGETAMAAIETAPNADHAALRQALEAICARELARYKRPAQWLMLPAFPRNAMLKVNRVELRDQCLALAAQTKTKEAHDA
jgi:acyl-CoA synthetase (AMP-forming)/AMP-acid ligase II